MGYYLCKTEDGLTIAPTQADAKSIDPGYETIDMPTDKRGRIDAINELLQRATPVSVAAPTPDTEPDTPPVPVPAPQSSKQMFPGECPRCHYTEKGGMMKITSDKLQHVMEFLLNLKPEEAFVLDNIQDCIDEQRGAFAEKPSEINPPRRRRKKA